MELASSEFERAVTRIVHATVSDDIMGLRHAVSQLRSDVMNRLSSPSWVPTSDARSPIPWSTRSRHPMSGGGMMSMEESRRHDPLRNATNVNVANKFIELLTRAGDLREAAEAGSVDEESLGTFGDQVTHFVGQLSTIANPSNLSDHTAGDAELTPLAWTVTPFRSPLSSNAVRCSNCYLIENGYRDYVNQLLIKISRLQGELSLYRSGTASDPAQGVPSAGKGTRDTA